MRIALCTDQYLPMLSGIADSVAILAEELRRRGHEVRVYTLSMPGAEPSDFVMRFPTYTLPGSGGGMVLVFPFGAMKDIRAFRPDVIHTHLNGIVGFFALYASWRLKVPFAGTDHTFPADYLHYMKLDYRPFRYLVRKFSSWYYNRCVIVTAPSQSLIDELEAYGLYRSARVISNHVPSDVFRPLPDKAALKRRLGIGERAVLLFGRIAKEKNLDFALDAFAKVAAQTAVELVVVGDGPYRAEFERKIAQKQLAERVRLLGPRRGEALVEAINACDVFLITSLSETQSMTTIQAMACGLPVVAADAGGLPEYVHAGKNGYVVSPQDADGFAQKLLALLADGTLRERMGKMGRESAADFTPERIAAQFEDVYRRAWSPQVRKISFVIPAYNEERDIGACLDSVQKELARARLPESMVEVIVVNNASTDGTRAAALAFPGVRVVDESRKGLVMARAAGYAASTGDVIANIDADTRLPEGWLSTVLERFNADPNLAALSGPYLYYDLSAFSRLLVKLFYAGGYLVYFFNHFVLGRGAMLQGGNFILRRSFFDRAGGFDTSIEFYGEDTDVARRVSRVGRVVWTWQLPMYASGRRLKAEGIVATGLRYALNFFWVSVTGKPYTRRYTDIRPSAVE